MRQIVFAPEAQRDLHEAWEYIAADNVNAADKLAGQIHQALTLLAEMPGIGHSRRDISNPRYCSWTVRPYVIVYRYSSRTLTVVRILHGARDFRVALS